MNIGIIGTGRMGSGLGRLWADKGHHVKLGSRDPQKARALAASLGRTVTGDSQAEAASFGEVVVLATPWGSAAEALQAAGPLEGKILVDVTNPLKADGSGLAIGHTTSGAEQVATCAPGAKVVKAFNGIFWGNLDARKFGTQRPSLFYCGDDRTAKGTVAKLGEEIGFEPVDARPLVVARYLEPLACLWMQLANNCGMGPEIAFTLIHGERA